jgi:hypothetical protein
MDSWLTGVHSARRELGSTVTIGTTEFTIRFVGEPVTAELPVGSSAQSVVERIRHSASAVRSY